MIDRIWIGVCCFSLFAAPIRGEDCQKAADALTAWRSRLVSIQLEAKTTFDVSHDEKLQSAWNDHEWIWDDLTRFRESKFYFENGQIRNRSLRMADRNKFYDLGFGTDPAISDPVNLTIYKNSSDHVCAGGIFTPLMVLWNAHDRKWLPELLKADSTASLTAEGYLEVPGDAIGWKGIAVHLDPAHNYLPVRSVEAEHGIEFEVTAFRELEPGLWFPWKGRLDVPDCKQTFEVTKVEVNRPLPDDLFVPEIPVGTLVKDLVSGREYYHSGKPPNASKLPQQVPQPVAGEHVIANPDRADSLSLWLVLGGAVLITMGIVIRRFS